MALSSFPTAVRPRSVPWATNRRQLCCGDTMGDAGAECQGGDRYWRVHGAQLLRRQPAVHDPEHRANVQLLLCHAQQPQHSGRATVECGQQAQSLGEPPCSCDQFWPTITARMQPPQQPPGSIPATPCPTPLQTQACAGCENIPDHICFAASQIGLTMFSMSPSCTKSCFLSSTYLP